MYVCIYILRRSKDHKIQPCPKCATPIEKDEGCNHIECASCKYLVILSLSSFFFFFLLFSSFFFFFLRGNRRPEADVDFVKISRTARTNCFSNKTSQDAALLIFFSTFSFSFSWPPSRARSFSLFLFFSFLFSHKFVFLYSSLQRIFEY